MKNLSIVFFFTFLICESCQSQPKPDTITHRVNKITHRHENGRFLLLEECSSNKIDTILNDDGWGVDEVIDVDAYHNKCIIIYRNGTLVAFNSFEKKDEKWHSLLGRELLTIRNDSRPHEFKIVDENHIRVKDQSTNKTKLYELNYLEKKVSFTETIDK